MIGSSDPPDLPPSDPLGQTDQLLPMLSTETSDAAGTITTIEPLPGLNETEPNGIEVIIDGDSFLVGSQDSEIPSIKRLKSEGDGLLGTDNMGSYFRLILDIHVVSSMIL